MGRLLFLRSLPLVPMANGFRALPAGGGQDNIETRMGRWRWGVGGSITENRTHGSIPDSSGKRHHDAV